MLSLTCKGGIALQHGFYKFIAFFLTLLLSSPANLYAQQSYDLPVPGKLVTASLSYSCPELKGIRFDPTEPLKLEFIIDTADKHSASKEEAQTLIKYFMAGLTTPEDDLWVNLSPYEKNKIIPESLSYTDLGKGMLGQDYLLKQLAASLTYPETQAGKKYWDEINGSVHNDAAQSFNKIWIVPGDAAVYESKNGAFITEATLKVMMEGDYLAMQKNNPVGARLPRPGQGNPAPTDAFKTQILPIIEQEVNRGKNFAQLRQIYNALILAVWFKQKFKESLYKNYIDQQKVQGIDLSDRAVKEKIYDLYLEAFKKGAYSVIQKEKVKSQNLLGGYKIAKRRYFSGGVNYRTLKPRRASALVVSGGLLMLAAFNINCAINKVTGNGAKAMVTNPLISDLPRNFNRDYTKLGEDERQAIDFREKLSEFETKASDGGDYGDRYGLGQFHKAGYLKNDPLTAAIVKKVEEALTSGDIDSLLKESERVKNRVRAGLKAGVKLPDGLIGKIIARLSNPSGGRVAANTSILTNFLEAGLVMPEDISPKSIENIMDLFTGKFSDATIVLVKDLISMGFVNSVSPAVIARILHLATDSDKTVRIPALEILIELAKKGVVTSKDISAKRFGGTDHDLFDLSGMAYKTILLIEVGILPAIPQSLTDALLAGLSGSIPFVQYQNAQIIRILHDRGYWPNKVGAASLGKIITDLQDNGVSHFTLEALIGLLDAGLINGQDIAPTAENRLFDLFAEGDSESQPLAARALVLLGSTSKRVERILKSGQALDDFLRKQITTKAANMPLGYRLELYRRMGSDVNREIFGDLLLPLYQVCPLDNRGRLFDTVIQGNHEGIDLVYPLISQTLDEFNWGGNSKDVRKFAEAMHRQVAGLSLWDELSEINQVILFYYDHLLKSNTSVQALRAVYNNRVFLSEAKGLGHMNRFSLARSILDIFQAEAQIPDGRRIAQLANFLMRVKIHMGSQVLAKPGASLFITAHGEKMFDPQEIIKVFRPYIGNEGQVHIFKAQGEGGMLHQDKGMVEAISLAQGKAIALHTLATLPYNPNGNIWYLNHHGLKGHFLFNQGISGRPYPNDAHNPNSLSAAEIVDALLARAKITGGDLSDITFFADSCFSGNSIIQAANILNEYIKNGTIKSAPTIIASNQRDLISWGSNFLTAIGELPNKNILTVSEINDADEKLGITNSRYLFHANPSSVGNFEGDPFYGQDISILHGMNQDEADELQAIMGVTVKAPCVLIGGLMPGSQFIGMMGNQVQVENFTKTSNNAATAEVIDIASKASEPIDLKRFNDHDSLIGEAKYLLDANSGQDGSEQVREYLSSLLGDGEDKPAQPQLYTFNTPVSKTKDLFGFAPSNENIIALHEKITALPARLRAIAALHELSHNLINRKLISLGLSYTFDGQAQIVVYKGTTENEAGRVTLKRMDAITLTQHELIDNPDYRDHYLLRALQRELFGADDVALSDEIAGFQNEEDKQNLGGLDLTAKGFKINTTGSFVGAQRAVPENMGVARYAPTSNNIENYDYLTADLTYLKDITRREVVDMLK